MTLAALQLNSRAGDEVDWCNQLARQLFDGNERIIVQSDREFDSLVKHATANKALARILPAVQGANAQLERRIEAAKAQQQKRLEEALRLLRETQRICEDMNVPYVVMKSFDALPDLGHDIDLLVAGNLPKVQRELIRKLQCYPVTLTFCDRQAGKFSAFIHDFTFDFELYARISQLGEHYYSEKRVLDDRVLEQAYDTQTFLCSHADRLLITCIHTMYRHGKVRLSDLHIAYNAFKNGVTIDTLIQTVEAAGIKNGFALFVTILENAGNRFLGRNIVPAKFHDYARSIIDSDPLLAWNAKHLPQRFPLKLPIAFHMLLFLYKSASDLAREKISSSLRSLLAPSILIIDKALPLKLQRATAVRIW